MPFLGGARLLPPDRTRDLEPADIVPNLPFDEAWTAYWL